MILCMDMSKIYFCQKLRFHINDYEQSNYEFILIPSQWGLFINALIPKSMGVIHWKSDTQPMEVICWYSDTQTSRGYSLLF